MVIIAGASGFAVVVTDRNKVSFLFDHRSLDCVYFVPVDYDAITACTGQFLAPRSFDGSCVAKFFRRRENFFVRANILEKKFGPTRSIPTKNHGIQSHPRDF